jgi:fibronectin-binding autotransporter adhesin
MKRTNVRMSGLCLVVAALFGAAAAEAQTVTNSWIKYTGQWTNAVNWSDGVPTIAQDVRVWTGATITVVGDASARSLTLAPTNLVGVGVNLDNTSKAASLTVAEEIVLGGETSQYTGSLTLGSGYATNAIKVTVKDGSGVIRRINGKGTLLVYSDVGALGVSAVSLDVMYVGTSANNGRIAITNGQVYTFGSSFSVASGNAVSTGVVTIAGGTLIVPTLTLGAGGATNKVGSINLKDGGILKVTTFQQVSNMVSCALNWDDGTIGNYANGTAAALSSTATNPSFVVNIAGSGTHTFACSNGITVYSTALLQDKAGEKGTVVKTGTGELSLYGPNTYSGGTTVLDGKLKLYGPQGVPREGTVLLNGSNVIYELRGVTATNGALVLAGGTIRGTAGIGIGVLYADSFTLSNGTINADAVLAGTGTVTKAGADIVTFSGTNTYSGATAVLGGTLRLTQRQALSTNTAVQVAAAAGAVLHLDFLGTNTVRSLTVDGEMLKPNTVYGTNNLACVKSGSTGYLRTIEGRLKGTLVRFF